MTYTISQVVFDAEARMTSRAAISSAMAEDDLYEASYRATGARVAEVYFKILRAGDVLDIAHQDRRAVEPLVERAALRLDAGMAAVDELYEVKARYNAALARISEASVGLADAQSGFEQVSGMLACSMRKISHQGAMKSLDEALASSRGIFVIDEHPVVRSAKHRLEAAEFSLRSARHASLPKISLTVGARHTIAWTPGTGHSSAEQVARQRDGVTVSLAMTVPLATSGGARARSSALRHERDRSFDALVQKRTEVSADLRRLTRSYVAAVSVHTATQNAVESARYAVDAAWAGMAVGMRSSSDVSAAQSVLLDARLNEANARYSLISNRISMLEMSSGAGAEAIEAIRGRADGSSIVCVGGA